MLHHIAYASSSRDYLLHAVLSEILEVSERNNARDGITGVLMYHDRLFFQVLEGDRDLVEHCYERIVKDFRHTGISLMWDNPVEERVFSDWAMGYAGSVPIGDYTSASSRSLADLLSEDDATKKSNIVVLGLARQMFKDFKPFKAA